MPDKILIAIGGIFLALTVIINRAFVYTSENNYKNEIEDENQALRLAPNNGDLLFMRGRAKLYNNQVAPAIDDLELSARLEPGNLYKALWLYLARLRMGQNDSQDLESKYSQADDNRWPMPIVGLYLGKTTIDDVFAKAKLGDDNKSVSQICEAHFYVAELETYAQKNRGDDAKKLFEAANQECPLDFIEHSTSKAELKMLEQQ